MRSLSRVLYVLAVFVLAFNVVYSCAHNAKARYYENMDMYDFVMTKTREAYDASTPAEQDQIEEQLLPILKQWSDANKVWKAALNDDTKEQAVMMAWANAKAALIQFGVVALEEVE